MGWPQRVTVVILAFLGFLILFGFRTVFTMMMVYVIKDNENNGVTLFKECTINGTAFDLQLDWSVATSQYFNTAYFVGYVITQLPGGYLAVRFSPTKIFGSSILVSGSCFLVLAFFMKYSPIICFGARFIQGLVEGMCQPAMSSVVSAWAPKSERARIVGVAYSGIYLSTSLASVISGAATCYISWHAGLIIYGSLAVLWSVVWICMVYDSPNVHPSLCEKERIIFEKDGSNILLSSARMAEKIPWKGILTSVPVWALFLINFTRSWVFAMMITEIPQYFADVFTLNVATIGFLTSFPPIVMSVSVILGGIMVDKLIKEEKVSVTAGRKMSIILGFGSEAVCVLALGFLRNYFAAAVLIIIAEGLAGLSSAGFKVNPVDLAPQYSSILTGVVRSGVLGATVSTALAGSLRQENAQSWQRIFLITGSLHLCSVTFYSVFGSGQQQKWAQPEYMTLVTSKGESDVIYGSNSITLSKNKMDLNEIVSNNEEENQKRSFDNQ
ncbi:vesicular glutamate transporter 3-like [Ostrea edulis]|uniref:vesicular glutamate transporter 3-like n=1 Tax=Ostrea edulis TaxID=37623 RepID=UPI0024AF8628|nr:vesicular glutamate transporter 3-like [Ostrea edulis]XP_048732822.2 vesicular glutamate transporter 3-like [Ostrea edulis]XP_048732823.2 vesicular glutamate transporter 3-like [Ostrea edulis]